MPGSVLCGINPGSPAARAGLHRGDVLLAIDGHRIRDVVDYQYFITAADPRLDILRDGRELSIRVRKGEGEPLGIEFDDMLMDSVRLCANRCMFCFVDQLPEGCRASMRVKDDDWRLSLLTGSYVTLTNVSSAELERIIARKASPLYISVHAAQPQVRARLLGNERGGDIMDKLRRLAAGGIRFHTQIVMCPGINDGTVLKETIDALLALEAVLSVAVVPVGMTACRRGLADIRSVGEDEARQTLALLEAYRGTGRVFASDELFVKAGVPVPPESYYGDYSQIDNGVGLMRLLAEDYRWASEQGGEVKPRRVTLLTGVSAADFLTELLGQNAPDGVAVRVQPVENSFFGASVTVTGLLTGADIVRAGLEAQARGDTDELMISRIMLREGEDVFLDGMTLGQVRARLALPLRVSPNDGEGLFAALSGRLDCFE